MDYDYTSIVRCIKEFRDYTEFTDKNKLGPISSFSYIDELSKSSSIKQREQLEKFLKYRYCYIKPLLTAPLKRQMTQCLKKNENQFDTFDKTCLPIYRNCEIKTKLSLMELYKDALSMSQTYKLQRSSYYCPEIMERAKALNCSTYGDKEACLQLRQDAFRCISEHSCNEVAYRMKGCMDTLQKNTEGRNILWYVLNGWDQRSKEALQNKCSYMQRDLFSCVDKYFILLGAMDIKKVSLGNDFFPMFNEENKNKPQKMLLKGKVTEDDVLEDDKFFLDYDLLGRKPMENNVRDTLSKDMINFNNIEKDVQSNLKGYKDDMEQEDDGIEYYEDTVLTPEEERMARKEYLKMKEEKLMKELQQLKEDDYEDQGENKDEELM